MGGHERSLEAAAKSGVADAKAEAEGVAARAETLAADTKVKIVEKAKSKMP